MLRGVLVYLLIVVLLEKTETQTESGTVRLTEGDNGLVEVYLNGGWGFICDDGWDGTDADVTCQILGYHSATQSDVGRYHPDTDYNLLYLNCVGSETSLLDCTPSYYSDYSPSYCSAHEHVYISCAPYIAPSYGCDAITNGGTCFSYFTTSSGVSWENARQRCNSWGYDLATVTSSQENSLLYNTRSSSSSADCWIGLHDLHSEGSYVWSGGSYSSYRNWNDGEPNNLYDEDCVHFFDSIYWNDLLCTLTLNCYFCSANVNQFGRIQYSRNYLPLLDDTVLTSDTTLFCITENKYTPQVVWSYQDLAKSTTSTLTSYTSSTTGVSSLRVYISRPGYYSCRVKVNGGSYKTYTALIADDLSTADGTLRLYDGSTENEGILEIFHDNRWGSICDHSWDSRDSKVACKQMGFPGYNTYYTSWRITNIYWLDHIRCSGNEASIADCSHYGWRDGHCSSNEGVYLKCYPAVTFGRMVGEAVDPLDNFQTLQQSTTLYCSTDVNTNTVRIGWSFTAFGQEIEESLTYSAEWELAYGMSKLDISTSKLGYYSCYTSKGDVSKKYTIKLTQPSLEKGCQGGYCFGVFRTDTAINWATAQSNCMSWGGDLASVRSIGEEKYILSLGDSDYGSCWIGHHDRYNEAGNNASLFVSVGGSNSFYRNFYTNEPNENDNEDCVMLRDWNEGGWNVTSCDRTLSCYVCGKPNCKDGSCFEVLTHNTSINWYSALNQCEQKGGSLASIRSEPEEKFILNLMTESSSQCWIGLNDRNSEANTNPNMFVWEDGNQAVYRHFRNETVNSITDCVVLSRDDGTWLSTNCDVNQSCSICKGADICTTGYEFITEQYDCLDINECNVANDCEQICTNTEGNYFCSCRERYYLSNFTSCELIYLNIDLNGISRSQSSIELSWNTIYRPIQRLSEIVYQVWMRDVTFENDKIFHLVGTTIRQQFQILNLLPYRTNEIYIVAIDNDTTNKSNTITVQTLTGIPSTSPSLTAISTNPITIRLNLTLPSRETRNGIITGYSIMYTRVEELTYNHVQTNGLVQTFDIIDLSPYSMYKFRAAAMTSAGTGVYTEYVYARTMESIPTGTPDIIFLGKSESSLFLQMLPPDVSEEINGVITFYTVTYKGTVIDTDLNVKEVLVESTDFLTPIKVNLTGLEEGVEYQIQARISTSVGGGPYSSAVTVTTIETAPTGPPLQFRIILQLPTILTLYWTPPELELQNGVITGYYIHYHGVYIDTQEISFTTQSLYVNLTNLEEGALYEISVCALSAAGEGPCVESTNRTREIPLGQPPQNVQVEVNGATSILVCWDNLLKSEENGIILNYVITAEGQSHDKRVYERTANSTARCYTCNNLQEANEYRISMTAENSAGTSPSSPVIVVITEEDIPSAAPINIFGIGNQNVIVLLWAPPLLSDQNGIIIKYEICYFGMIIDKTKYHIQSTAASAIISGLDEGETYHIKVRAYTLKGPGPYSLIININTIETPPSAPPTNVTLIPTSSTQLLVTWEEPPLADKNGVITNYDITISPSNRQLIRVEASVRAYTFRDLDHVTNYSVRVRARTLPGPGPYCDLVTATTLGKSPVY
ncbi:Phosphatidylinositol phosphatase PTPRQ-like isoform X2 [Oopsacas minuta]|uniref:Phosphatidylinositol phosphatase PTPRQ-like isoform X2 n=1 Tax=Oopsacas minuta TaxID=111878 RepID=A0AAV7KK80_9METZ|nr:Phosphatidylinositol phosphatase PTPRQ-like isoform X2 [Oopsacas minuta]